MLYWPPGEEVWRVFAPSWGGVGWGGVRALVASAINMALKSGLHLCFTGKTA